jgi:hypothetical protein
MKKLLIILSILIYSSVEARPLRITNRYASLKTYLKVPEIDAFIVAGQSNAKGQGLTASNVDSGSYAYDFSSKTIKKLKDPVGGATIGSAWPKFCADYTTSTLRKVIIIETAVNGSAQAAGASSDNWDTTGILYTQMLDKTNSRIERLNRDGVAVILRGILWVQGERDADQIDGAVINKATYKTALEGMITRLQSDFSGIKLYISQTGTKNTGDTSGFSDIRAAQSEVATASDFADLAFSGAVNFEASGKMADLFHYTTGGYEDVGAGMASYIITDNPSGITYR